MFLSVRFREVIKPFFLLLLLLSMQLSSFSHGRRITKREAVRMRLEAKPSSPSTGYFSQAYSQDGEEEDEIDPLYGVSKRFVPQGPNPLHN